MPSKVRAPILQPSLTAIAATNGKRQRSAAHANTDTLLGDWGDTSAEKQTVGDRGRSAATAANTAAKPLDNTGPRWTAVECRPSARTATDSPGRCAYSYGSEGRARRVPDQAVNRGYWQSLAGYLRRPAGLGADRSRQCRSRPPKQLIMPARHASPLSARQGRRATVSG